MYALLEISVVHHDGVHLLLKLNESLDEVDIVELLDQEADIFDCLDYAHRISRGVLCRGPTLF